MKKTQIFSAFISHFEDLEKRTKGTLEDTRELVREAPGSNVSHSDTSRFQLGNLTAGQGLRLQEIQKILEILRAISTQPKEVIHTGAVFTIINPDTEEERTFVVFSAGGGETITLDGKRITSISFSAPLIRACRGKEEWDMFVFNDSTFEITEVF